MKFISDMTGSLAWPVVAAIAIFFFKAAIIERLRAMTEVTLPGGVEAKFGQELKQADAAIAVAAAEVVAHATITEKPDTVESIAVIETRTTQVSSDLESRYTLAAPDLASEDPRALRANATGIVMAAWANLESAIRLLAARHLTREEVAQGPGDISHLIFLLASHGVLLKPLLVPTIQLRELRDHAAHNEFSVSTKDASRYSELASHLLSMMLVIAEQAQVRTQ